MRRTNALNTGIGFQKRIEAVAAQYLAQGYMTVTKVDPPVRIFGGRVIFQLNAWPDFAGAWREMAGRMVCFECKSTADYRLGLGGSSGITDKQLDALRRWHNYGAAAFILWEHAPSQKVLFVTASDAAAISTERKHLRWEDGQPVVQGMKWVTHDFRQNMIQAFSR